MRISDWSSDVCSSDLVRKGDSTDPADYFDSDRVVGALQGSFYVALWKQHAPSARILEYQELPELVVALAQGKVDVVPTMRSQAFGIMEALGERAEGLAVDRKSTRLNSSH